MIVTNLNQQEIEKLLEGVFTSKQQRRFIEYVAANPRSLTLSVNRATAIGNCSAIARRVNKKLMPLGYAIVGLRPIDRVSNRFGEPSNIYRWSLFKLPLSSANDPSYGSVKEVSE